MPAAVAGLAPVEALPDSQRLNLAISLPARNSEKLDLLLRQLYDPASPNYRHYLTPVQFTDQFGASESDYAAVIAFARSNQLTITAAHLNRLVLDVSATTAEIEQAFHLKLRVYNHPSEDRTFFAPENEPWVAEGLAIQHISGLDNYSLPHPNSRPMPLEKTIGAQPRNGSGPSGSYLGGDFRAAYVPGTTLNGAGQSVGLLEFDGYYANDITSYENQIGLSANHPQLVNVAIDGGVSKPGTGNGEVALDIEMVLAMAPGVSAIYIYEAPNPSPWVDLLSKMANDNLAKQLSCSWGAGAPDPASETIFRQMAAQGQSFFNATGDSDAFTGAIPFPSDSINVVQVGGTTLTTGSGSTYSSETAWNWGRGSGSSGGISTYFAIPSWQTNVSMAANQGSTTMRNVPDVALTADNVYVTYNNGSAGTFGGTSCAAPLWAAFTALVNQRGASAGLAPVGFLNPALYAIGTGPNYASCFHDVTTGNNTWTRSRSKFYAVSGYDLCTGWGTPNGTTLINALAPVQTPPLAGFSVSPAVGAVPLHVAFTDTSSGVITSRSWNFGNGARTNTAATNFVFTYNSVGTNTVSLTVSGPAGSNTFTAVAAILVTNAPITMASNAPTVTGQPQSLAVPLGGEAAFHVLAAGSLPLSYQWRFNGTNIPGATNTSYTRFSAQSSDAGLYDVVVTNTVGSVTSSNATLRVVTHPYLIAPIWSSKGNFAFTLSGDTGLTYAIEGSTDLLNWSTVATLTNAVGQVVYADTNSPSLPLRLFRARWLP